MNKKLIIATVIGAVVLMAFIGTVASAASPFATDSQDEVSVSGQSMNGNMNGDCDRIMAQDGSCEECLNEDCVAAGNCTCAMNQYMQGEMYQHQNTNCICADGECDSLAFQYQYQHRNGAA